MMDELLSATIGIVASHVTHNSVAAADLLGLIQAVHKSLETIAIGTRVSVEENSAPKLVPAVPIRKSVHHDYIVSLETGQRFQTLVRHLGGLGMSPDAYRAKWGLPNDYPMTAKGYSERRSALAKSLGLGRKPAMPVEALAAVSKPRRKPTAADKVPTTMAESVQDPAETAAMLRPDTTVSVNTEASTTASGNVQEPTEAVQKAA